MQVFHVCVSVKSLSFTLFRLIPFSSLLSFSVSFYFFTQLHKKNQQIQATIEFEVFQHFGCSICCQWQCDIGQKKLAKKKNIYFWFCLGFSVRNLFTFRSGYLHFIPLSTVTIVSLRFWPNCYLGIYESCVCVCNVCAKFAFHLDSYTTDVRKIPWTIVTAQYPNRYLIFLPFFWHIWIGSWFLGLGLASAHCHAPATYLHLRSS